MTKQKYLQRLLELKAFLKNHPEQLKVYSDIPVNFLIMQTKKLIYEEEDENYVQIGCISNGFEKTDFNPFL